MTPERRTDVGERIWDKYLTEQDKAYLGGKEVPPIGFGQRPALLYIDLYSWVFGDRPEPLVEAIKRWPASCGLAGWEALPHLKRLLAAARQAEIPIIHVTGDESATIRWQTKASYRDRSKSSQPHPLQIVADLAPQEGEVFVRKAAPSAFWGTPLMSQLIRLGVDTLIVGGESTSGCVRASVVDGSSALLRMMVVEECVFDRQEAPHAMSLFDMNQKYADVVSVDDTIDYLTSSTNPSERSPAAIGA
ncbi:MAG: isochorismatase family protein [Dehalococcoidia bacterium]|nr:isochorismatase family protein [Dehalococcoidia bacterium]